MRLVLAFVEEPTVAQPLPYYHGDSRLGDQHVICQPAARVNIRTSALRRSFNSPLDTIDPSIMYPIGSKQRVRDEFGMITQRRPSLVSVFRRFRYSPNPNRIVVASRHDSTMMRVKCDGSRVPAMSSESFARENGVAGRTLVGLAESVCSGQHIVCRIWISICRLCLDVAVRQAFVCNEKPIFRVILKHSRFGLASDRSVFMVGRRQGRGF